MSGLRWWVLALGSAMAIAGCASVPTARTDAAASAIDDPSLSPSPTSEAAERAKGLTQSPSDPTERPLGSSETAEETVTEDYDPWEPFNTAMFSFNRKVDRYALKPVAKAWDKIVPDPVERSLKRAFDNLSMPRRLVNNLFQLKLKGAGQELARFGLNTTLGVAGLFDVAKVFGLEASEADTGQTLGPLWRGARAVLGVAVSASSDGPRWDRLRRGRSARSVHLRHLPRRRPGGYSGREARRRAGAQPRSVRERRGEHRRPLQRSAEWVSATAAEDDRR